MNSDARRTPANSSQANMLVVAVAFKDKLATQSLNAFQQLYFGSQGSVADYYRTVSYGAFRLFGTVIGDPQNPGNFLTLPHTEAYYAGKDNGDGSPFPNNTDGIVSDAITELVADHFDFAPYVVNGRIPYLAFVFSGYGADVDSGNSQLIWPVENDLATPISVAIGSNQGTGGTAKTVANTAQIINYDLVPELGDTSGSVASVGVYAHEFGHLLGLDDLYDTSTSVSAGLGDGPWSTMAEGNWNGSPLGSSPAELDPMSRIELGWLTPAVISQSETGVRLPALESQPVVYELKPLGKEQDYFLVANVQLVGYDAALPEAGVMIWHIDGREANMNSSDWVNNVLNSPSQNTTGHYDVAVVEAGNKGDLTDTLTATGTYDDTYPSAEGNNQFTATSVPNNDLWDGRSVGIDVTNISIDANGNATFDVRDEQNGSSLVIMRPKTELRTYQGVPFALTAQVTQGSQTRDVSSSAVWSTSTPGVSFEGSKATATLPGNITINAALRGLQAGIYLQGIAVSKLQLGQTVMPAPIGGGIELPSVLATYADGKVLDVSPYVMWHTNTPAGRVLGGKYVGPIVGKTVLIGSFAGKNVMVALNQR